MNSAIIHDWLVSAIGGSENVLQAIHTLFPSPIFTLLYNQEALANSYFDSLTLHPSFLQKLPLRYYRQYLPLFPLAISQLDTSPFSLLLSSSHCVAKGITKRPDQLHICYCHTPMRYAWDLMDDYLEEAHLNRGLKRWIAKQILLSLRKWDKKTSINVDHFIANSAFVAERIKQYYGRDATVIYPPVDTDYYEPQEKKENYFLTASRLVHNKRIDLIVEAFAQIPHEKLFVIGDGPLRKTLEQKAPPNVTFLGQQSKENLKHHLQNAKAFLFAAIEDFGILPVEAMATGTPVIALDRGGTKETVLPGKTGLLYPEQTQTSLLQAIRTFSHLTFDSRLCRLQAEQFSRQKFDRQFQTFVLDKYEPFMKNR